MSQNRGNIMGAFISLCSSRFFLIYWNTSLATLWGNIACGKSEKQTCPLQQFVRGIKKCIFLRRNVAGQSHTYILYVYVYIFIL